MTERPPSPPGSTDALNVVLFSGGRGSGALARMLAAIPRVRLTVTINGYDDGASTGEVRRFLGDALGPSDFRKNASRLAGVLQSASASLIELLDQRLPAGAVAQDFERLLAAPPAAATGPVLERLTRFEAERRSTGRSFAFCDCAIGNLVFAGSYLGCGRNFNRAVDDYCALLGLPPGLVENVTDGANAFLVATDGDGRVLGSEEEIVDARRRNRIAEIFLVDRPPTADERTRLDQSPGDAARFFDARAARIRLNARLASRIAAARLVIYAPGTQHSSLFPSYLTPGLAAAIAANLGAIKLLLTNLQADAEIVGSSAVDIIERAVYYLKEKGRLGTPTPCLITHYLMNDPGLSSAEAPYVPLGAIETLEDPRLVRIGDYEDGVSGRHDAVRVLGPFIASLVERRHRQKVAVLLHDADSINKVVQSILEIVRGGGRDIPVEFTVFYMRREPLDPAFVASLPFAVRCVDEGPDVERRLHEAIAGGPFDYVLLFESSGMYRGEDVVSLASHLAGGRFDAVWGSRRLSVRDIQESYRIRYRHRALLGATSYIGSHLLSLAYLLLYGRYVSDTLSAVRAVRVRDVLDAGVALTHKQANQHLLVRLLRRRAELLEVPVQFLPISPDKVKRTTVRDGLRALGIIAWGRLAGARAARTPA
jgi:2-phospho-L-lactate transferase/gluconeogenesis factor (CofD/UPF0052 family)